MLSPKRVKQYQASIALMFCLCEIPLNDIAKVMKVRPPQAANLIKQGKKFLLNKLYGKL